jgi:1,4-dihydroxy-2-naphthoate octaprenyltransferase
MNIPIWAKSLQNRQPLTPEKWQRMGVVERWLQFANQGTLLMTLIPAAAAGLLAWRAGQFDLLRWALLAAGLVLAHAFNNMINDFVDALRGVDHGDYIKERVQPPPTHHGLLSRKQALLYMGVTGAAALGCGAYLAATGGRLILLLLILGFILDVFYVYPIKLIGLGELSIAAVWGPLMIGGGYYVLTDEWSWSIALFSLSYSFSVMEVLLGRHLDKIEADRSRKIHTLPALLGERSTRQLIFCLALLQYLIVIYYIGVGFFSPAMLVVLLAAFITLPMLSRAYLQPKPASLPDGYPEAAWYMWFIAPALINNFIYGIFWLLALAVESMLRGY